MLWFLNRHPEDGMGTTASGNIMVTFHIFIARFKSTNVGWAWRMLRYNCSSPAPPRAPCVVVAAVVLLYIYLICNTSSAQNTGWVTTAAYASLLQGINCNYLVLIGPCHQLGAAGHQDTASRSTHCPFNWSSWRRWKRWRDKDIFQNIR